MYNIFITKFLAVGRVACFILVTVFVLGININTLRNIRPLHTCAYIATLQWHTTIYITQQNRTSSA